MTVQSTSVQTSQVATGLITTFTYQFKLLNAADLTVQVEDLSGVFHTLVLNSDYTIDPLGIGLDAGGNILNCTYLGADIPNGWTVVMTRETAITQDVDLANQGTYLPENVEGGLDTGITIQQEQAFSLARCIRGLLTDPAMPVLPAALSRLGMYLQFDPVTGMPNAVPGAPSVLKDNFAANTFPTTVNDSTQGYSEGSRWFDTTHNTVWICMSAAVGAAVWVQLVFKNNLTAVTVPSASNDNTQGYSIQSLWLNTATGNLYVCISAATGAAVWAVQTSQSSIAAPVNSFVDPCCRVATVGSSVLTALATSRKYGVVDLVQCWASGTAVTAGTIGQDNLYTVAAAATNFSCEIAGATITGTGKVFFRKWVESRDASAYIQKNGNFSLLLRHNVGSNINASLTVNAFQSQDNPGTPTLIATGSGSPVSVPTGTDTPITLAVANMGTNVINGFEVILEVDCGAITTKNFWATDWMASPTTLPTKCPVPEFASDMIRALRYYEQSFEYGTAPGTITTSGMISGILAAAIGNGATLDCITPHFKVEKLTVPTITVYSPNSGTSGNIFNQGGLDKAVSVVASKQGFIPSNNSGGSFGVAGTVPEMHWKADARL